jgi:hypothetical protein
MTMIFMAFSGGLSLSRICAQRCGGDMLKNISLWTLLARKKHLPLQQITSFRPNINNSKLW